MPWNGSGDLVIALAAIVFALHTASAIPVFVATPDERFSPTPVPSTLPTPTLSEPTATPIDPGPTVWPSPSGESPEAQEPASDLGLAYLAGEPRPARQAKGAAAVDVVDNQFRPMQLTVTVGATVVWTHEGQNPHTVTADDRTFDSGTLESGTFSVTFDDVGRVPYYCQIHGEPGSGMFGTVVVQAAPAEEEDQASPVSDSNGLARTGLDPIPLVIVAFGLAMAGLLLLRLGRNAAGERR